MMGDWTKGVAVEKVELVQLGVCFISSLYSLWLCWVVTQFVEILIKWLRY